MKYTIKEIQEIVGRMDSLNSSSIKGKINEIVRGLDGVDDNTKELLMILVSTLLNKKEVECLDRVSELVDFLKQNNK